MQKRVLLSDEVQDWIDRAMPELGGIGSVKIFCCTRLPFAWLPGFGARFDGVTLWTSIYVHERAGAPGEQNRGWMELLFHELVHVRQFRERPTTFPAWYLWKLARVGYVKHPAEIEARRRAAELSEQFYIWITSG